MLTSIKEIQESTGIHIARYQMGIQLLCIYSIGIYMPLAVKQEHYSRVVLFNMNTTISPLSNMEQALNHDYT